MNPPSLTPPERRTPRYEIKPSPGQRVHGVCEHCDWRTASYSSPGFIASVMSAHGLVLSDEPTPGVPVCGSVSC